MNIIEIIQWIITNPGTILNLVLAAIGLASVIVKLTPTQKDDNILKYIIAIVDKYVALNPQIEQKVNIKIKD